MLVDFVVQLLTFCSMLLLAGWVVEVVAQHPFWTDRNGKLDPRPEDSWFAHHLHQ